MHQDDARALIVDCLGTLLASPTSIVIPDDDEADLRVLGLVDSLKFVQLLGTLEHRLGRPIDLSEMDPLRLTHLGALSRHLAAQL